MLLSNRREFMKFSVWKDGFPCCHLANQPLGLIKCTSDASDKKGCTSGVYMNLSLLSFESLMV